MAGTDPFVPATPAPVDPDDALADLEADFEGLTAPPEVVVVPEDPPPLGRSWGFDFIGGSFRTGPSRNPLRTNDISTLIQWCEKALRTRSGSPIHPPGYGMDDPDMLIGRTLSGAPVGELEQAIRSTLTFHPRISDVRDFAYKPDEVNEWISVAFTVVVDDVPVFAINTRLAQTTVAAEF